jgi:hypothetical protein
MIFFLGSSKKKKARKKAQKKLREALCRRDHMIIEARKKHQKNRKDAEKSLAKGGFAEVEKMEEDLGGEIVAGVTKAVKIGGKGIEKLKARQKSLQKSRKTHLAKLQAARAKMAARQR